MKIMMKKQGTGAPSQYITDGLMLHVDVNDPASYPGTGNYWYDLSGNGYDLYLRALGQANGTEYHTNITGSNLKDGVKAFQFAGGNSGAYYPTESDPLVGRDLPGPASAQLTIQTLTVVDGGTANYRTLTRGFTGDHQVIMNAGTHSLGQYDSDVGGFAEGVNLSAGALTDYNQKFHVHTYRLNNNGSPYWEVRFNDNPVAGTITTYNHRLNRMFGIIGNYQNQNQGWGRIVNFLVYDRHLTDQEILDNYNAIASKYLA